MAKIFITGGFGYIGSKLAKEAIRAGHVVHIYDSLLYEQDEVSLQSQIGLFTTEFTIGDIRNYRLLEQTIRGFAPDFLFHFAELSGVYACNHNPAYTESINYRASRHVLWLCERFGIKVIYNSSSSVYGVQEGIGPCSESAALPSPSDHYVAKKLGMEKYIKSRPNLKAIIFRPATVYGLSPRFRIDLMQNHFSYMAVAKGTIKVFQPGAYRAGIDVADLCQAYLQVVKKGKWKHQIYNIGTVNLTKGAFAEGIKNMVVGCTIEETQAADKRDLQISSKRFDEEFGLVEPKPYEQSVAEIVAWIRTNLDEIQKTNFAGMLTAPLSEWLKICS